MFINIIGNPIAKIGKNKFSTCLGKKTRELISLQFLPYMEGLGSLLFHVSP